MIEFTSSVIKQAVDICGEAPCDFAAVCMGSMARGEMTPYSDLEFIFLVENKKDGVEEYFERLALTVYFLIGNLGETHLKYMNIEEFSERKGSPISLDETRAERWFDDTSTNGFKIDGLSPNAGNIPTGNGSEEQHNHLIVTVEELVSRYTEVYLQVSDYKKASKGDLSAMLSSTTLIYGAEDLFNTFRGSITKVQPSQKRQFVSREMLLIDAEKFSFEPQKNMMEKVNLKEKVYRFPTILTFDLKILHCLKSSTCWEVLTEAEDQGQISHVLASDLAFLVSVGLYVRFSAYSAYASQNDVPSVALSSTRAGSTGQTTETWKIPRALLLMMIVHGKGVQQLFKGHDDRQTIPESNHQAMNDEAFALTWFYCQDYDKFLNTSRAMEAMKTPPENAKWAFMTVKAHLEKSKFSTAEMIIKKLMEDKYMAVRDRAETYRWYGELLRRLGKYEDAVDFYHRALAIRLIRGSSVAEEDVAACYMDIGRMMDITAQYKEAIKWYEKSLTTRLAAHGDTNHQDIATSYHNIGLVHQSQGDYQQALKNHEKSLAMRLAVYGDANHPDIAYSYNSIGSVYYSQEDYQQALKSHEKSLATMQAVYGNVDHPDIASSYHNIGLVHDLQGD